MSEAVPPSPSPKVPRAVLGVLALAGAAVLFFVARQLVAGRAPPEPMPASAVLGPKANAVSASAGPAPSVAPSGWPSWSTGFAAAAPPADRNAQLTQMVDAQRARFGGCFREHPLGSLQEPEVTVHFGIAEDGKVKAVALAPGSLNGTPLGKCLTKAAKETRFAPQAKPTTFSVPLRSRLLESSVQYRTEEKEPEKPPRRGR